MQLKPKPVYRPFQMLHEAGDERLIVDGFHHTVDAWAFRQRSGLTIRMTNHAPQQSIHLERVRVTLQNSGRRRSTSVRQIDGRHANARRTWLQRATPACLSSSVVERLDAASRLREERCAWEFASRTAYREVDLPDSVAAVVLECQSV